MFYFIGGSAQSMEISVRLMAIFLVLAWSVIWDEINASDYDLTKYIDVHSDSIISFTYQIPIQILTTKYLICKKKSNKKVLPLMQPCSKGAFTCFTYNVDVQREFLTILSTYFNLKLWFLSFALKYLGSIHIWRQIFR